MFLKGVITVSLFAGALAAADFGASDIFTVRSFRVPAAKEKIQVTAKLFETVPDLRAESRNSATCVIPLREFKPDWPESKDPMAKPVGPIRDPAVKPSPIPVCKGWQ